MVVNYNASLEEKINKVSKKLLPLNLQFFAEGGEGSEGDSGGSGEGAGDGQEGNGKGAGDNHGGNPDNNRDGQDGSNGNKGDTQQGARDGNSGKVFTQQDVNNIAAREAKKAQEKFLKALGVKDIKDAKSALQEYQRQQDEQMTDYERAQKELKTLSEQNQALEQTIGDYEAKFAALTNEVKPESVDDVVVLAKALVNDETTIDEAVKEVVEKYPHFKREAQQQEGEPKKKPKFSNGEHGGNAKPSEKDAWINAFNWTN